MTKRPGELISGLELDKYVRIGKVNPVGALEARKLTSGVVFYWRFTFEGRSHRITIGSYSSSAPPKSLEPKDGKFSVAAAARAAELLATKHKGNLLSGGYMALLSTEAEARSAVQQAKRDATARQLAEQNFTLTRLMDDYCDFLKNSDKVTHRAVRTTFKNHVVNAWPEVASLPAKAVTDDHISEMMRRLHERGNGRTSNKLRSYLHAAFAVAKASKSRAEVPRHFKGYEISSNPVAETSPTNKFNRADKRPLSIPDLKAYWGKIKNMPEIKGAVLRLHLLTGGQRIEQLACLLNENIHPNHIIIIDLKGRDAIPRPHFVPLIPASKKALKECANEGKFALSLREGKTHISSSTLSKWAKAAAGESIANFQAKRVRSGVETLLAASKISKDLRGRLQSHGISGVQDRHYDGHDYIDEVRELLDVLYKKLNEKTGNARSK